MSNVALYARVSSEIQEKEATIESQVAFLREAAAKQGDIVIQEYRDDGFSGDLLARPALDKLRDDAAKHLFDRVIVLSPDRLARKFVYGEVIADELRKHGVTIQFLNQKDDGTEESKLLLGITGLFAQYEKAKINERCRRGRLFRARSGLVMTSKAPYGYTYVPKTSQRPGHFVINQDQAKVVRLIFDLYGAQEKTVSDIGAELYHRGIRSATGNQRWERCMIMKVLRDTTFIGVWHYNKKVAAQPRKIRKPAAIRRRLNTTEHVRSRDQWVAVPGIDPIVDLGTFDAAQRQLDRSRHFSRRNRRNDYLLAGLCRCGACGRAVAGVPSRKIYTYYRCTGSFSFGGFPGRCAAKKGIPVPRTDAAIWSAVRQAFANPQVVMKNITPMYQLISADAHAQRKDREEISRQLAQIKVSETRLLDAYSAQAMEVDQLREQMQKLRERRQVLDLQLAEPATDVPLCPPALDEAVLEEVCSKLARGLDILEAGDFAARQKFMRTIVEKIVLSPEQAVLTVLLPLPEGLQEPFHSLDVGPLQQHRHNPVLKFKLAVALC